jgi:hypothetical protein
MITDLLTGPDNKTYDLVRCQTFAATVVGLALQIHAVIRGQVFDFTAFGTGLGLLIAAGAGGMWARKDVEVSNRPRPAMGGTSGQDGGEEP